MCCCCCCYYYDYYYYYYYYYYDYDYDYDDVNDDGGRGYGGYGHYYYYDYYEDYYYYDCDYCNGGGGDEDDKPLWWDGAATDAPTRRRALAWIARPLSACDRPADHDARAVRARPLDERAGGRRGAVVGRAPDSRDGRRRLFGRASAREVSCDARPLDPRRRSGVPCASSTKVCAAA